MKEILEEIYSENKNIIGETTYGFWKEAWEVKNEDKKT
jgi:hypothetical protein